MKIGLFLILLFLSASLSAVSQETQHVGSWTFFDDEEITIELNEKGYATFSTIDETYGGKPKVNEDGVLVWLTYRVDYSTSPNTIVLTTFMKEDGLEDSFEAPGLFEMMEDGKKMKLLFNFSDEIYPTEFNDEDTVIATKVT